MKTPWIIFAALAVPLAACAQPRTADKQAEEVRVVVLQGAVSRTRPAQARPTTGAPVTRSTIRTVETVRPATFFFRFPDLDPRRRIVVDVDNAPIRRAVAEILQKGAPEVTAQVDSDVPEDARFSLRAKNVELGTALELIGQAAEAGWRLERKDNRTTLRLGRSLKNHASLRFSGGDVVQGLTFTPSPAIAVNPFMLERHTFTCPHCKRQATHMRPRDASPCGKCGRPFQSTWQFCPYDGTKRPTAASDWRFCPHCGKEVKDAARRSEADPHTGGAPILSRIPLIERLFRILPPGCPAHRDEADAPHGENASSAPRVL